MWSAEAAARFGLPYAFAHFIDPQTTRSALEHYQANFTTGQYLPKPQALVALGAVCAETREEAEWINSSTRLLIRRIRQGDRRPIAPPEEAVKELESGPDPSIFVVGEWPRYTVGTPEQVRDQLTNIGEELGVDEIMLVTVVHSHEARMKSYQLLAEAFELVPQAV